MTGHGESLVDLEPYLLPLDRAREAADRHLHPHAYGAAPDRGISNLVVDSNLVVGDGPPRE